MIAHHDSQMDYLSIFMRALHVFSAVTLIGGVLAWRFAAIPGLESLAPETRGKVDNAIAARWRSAVMLSVLGLLVSGVYNFLHKVGMSPTYHMVFGIKILLALHVFAAAMLATRPDNGRRARQLTGVALSGTVIVILSAILRWISTQ
jgi:hypothetical protein